MGAVSSSQSIGGTVQPLEPWKIGVIVTAVFIALAGAGLAVYFLVFAESDTLEPNAPVRYEWHVYEDVTRCWDRQNETVVADTFCDSNLRPSIPVDPDWWCRAKSTDPWELCGSQNYTPSTCDGTVTARTREVECRAGANTLSDAACTGVKPSATVACDLRYTYNASTDQCTVGGTLSFTECQDLLQSSQVTTYHWVAGTRSAVLDTYTPQCTPSNPVTTWTVECRVATGGFTGQLVADSFCSDKTRPTRPVDYDVQNNSLWYSQDTDPACNVGWYASSAAQPCSFGLWSASDPQVYPTLSICNVAYNLGFPTDDAPQFLIPMARWAGRIGPVIPWNLSESTKSRLVYAYSQAPSALPSADFLAQMHDAIMEVVNNPPTAHDGTTATQNRIVEALRLVKRTMTLLQGKWKSSTNQLTAYLNQLSETDTTPMTLAADWTSGSAATFPSYAGAALTQSRLYLLHNGEWFDQETWGTINNAARLLNVEFDAQGEPIIPSHNETETDISMNESLVAWDEQPFYAWIQTQTDYELRSCENGHYYTPFDPKTQQPGARTCLSNENAVYSAQYVPNRPTVTNITTTGVPPWGNEYTWALYQTAPGSVDVQILEASFVGPIPYEYQGNEALAQGLHKMVGWMLAGLNR